MKNSIIYTLAALSLLLFAACEEVIEIDLNSSNPAIVVDGTLSIGSTANIKLSYTSDYFTNDAPNSIEDATVTLISDRNETEVLTHTLDGLYLGKTILGKANTSYTLQLEINDQVLDGQSEMPAELEFISFTMAEASFARPGQDGTEEKRYTIEMEFSDDKDQENYYMLVVTKNGEEGEYSYLLIDDEFYPETGVISYAPMMYQFEAGDTAYVQLYSFDKATYAFYNQLSDVTGNGGMRGMMVMGTPYNPGSNMGDDVLGYFKAWTRVDTSLVIQPY